MTLKEYIAALKTIEEGHGGNLQVKRLLGWDIYNSDGPEVRFLKLLTGKKRKDKFWQREDEESLKGEKVVFL